MTAPIAPPRKHNLLIEPVWKPGRGSAFWSLFRWLRRLPRDYPVQYEPFHFALRVKNIDGATSPSCAITDVSIRELGPGQLMVVRHGPFPVRSLNAGDAETIPVDLLRTGLSGLVLVECEIAAKDPGGGGLRDPHWSDEWFIHQRTDVNTGRTNEILIVLTLITVLEFVIGRDTLLGWVKTTVHALLVWLSGLTG